MQCEHGYPKPTMCVDCIQEGPLPPAPEPVLAIDHLLYARYDGLCSGCGDDILPGMRIAALTDDTYAHHPQCTPTQEHL